jgi:hypothetical protein
MPINGYTGKYWLVKRAAQKRGRTEVSVSSNWQPWCQSAGTISNIDVGSYWGCHRLRIAISVCQWPRPSSGEPTNRSIEEERIVQVLVRDNNADQAPKVLKKQITSALTLPSCHGE